MITDALANVALLADLDALRGIINVVPHPIFVKDEQHRFVVVNQAMCDLMGRSYDELVGRTDADFVPLDQAEVFLANDRRVLDTGESNENEESLSGPDGEIRTIIARKQRMQLADGARFVVGCITDITGFRRAERVIRHNAEHDALTGLANRSLLRESLQHAIENEKAEGLQTGLLLIDLDGFKNVNDVFGHAAGDALLVEMAGILSGLTRPTDTVARLGGDEFAVVQRAAEQPQAAIALANAIIASMGRPMQLGAGQAFISASVGIADMTAGAVDRETLMRRADLALYGAKNDGRNTWRLFESGMEATHILTRLLEDDLRKALDRGEFSIVYQPFVGARDLTLRGFEALVRWRHPIHGEIAPSTFVPVAERIGLIAPFGEWILRKVLAEAAEWPSHLRVSVNLSPIQFGQLEFPSLLAQIVKETGIDPRRIDLEITEGAVIADIARARRVFAVLQEIGVGVVLDDFGSGFSSIETLRALPFDKIKIDRHIMQKVGEEPIADAVLSAFLRLGHTLNLPVTVEGVETDAQLAVVRREFCDELQGYLVGRPAPWAHYAPMIAAAAADRKTA
jgi:diguanylate cyclase (GGDEF)-like protein/PAS domain S-box-containing protein